MKSTKCIKCGSCESSGTLFTKHYCICNQCYSYDMAYSTKISEIKEICQTCKLSKKNCICRRVMDKPLPVTKLSIAIEALKECEIELNNYYHAEYPLNYGRHKKVRGNLIKNNPATKALKEINDDEKTL